MTVQFKYSSISLLLFHLSIQTRAYIVNVFLKQFNLVFTFIYTLFTIAVDEFGFTFHVFVESKPNLRLFDSIKHLVNLSTECLHCDKLLRVHVDLLLITFLIYEDLIYIEVVDLMSVVCLH